MLVIWKDVPVTVKQKIHCSVRHGRNRYIHSKRIVQHFGDLPVCEIDDNVNAHKIENHRGFAYARRNDIKYRKTKKQKLAQMV